MATRPLKSSYVHKSQSELLSTTEVALPGDSPVELLTISRLPGESLGMECDVIDGDVTGNSRGCQVFVRRVVSGSPAERASGSSKGVEVGDEILSINGVELTMVQSRVEIFQFITETPLTVILLVRRQAVRLEHSEKDTVTGTETAGCVTRPSYALQTCRPSYVHEGFQLRQVTFHKLPADKLALQLERCVLRLHTYFKVFFHCLSPFSPRSVFS